MRYTKLQAVENYISLQDQELTDIEERAFQAYKAMNVAPVLEHVSDVMEVTNYKAELPKDLTQIRFVSYMAKTPTEQEFNSLCSECDTSDENKIVCTACNDGVATLAQYPVGLLEKQACRIRHQGITYIYDYYHFVNSSFYKNNFEIMMPRRTPFSSTKVCKECQPACSDCTQTYEILPTNEILTSFEEGTVCIDYFRIAKDEDGDILIPDDPILLEALSNYVMWKHWEERWNANNQAAGEKMREYRNLWKTQRPKYIANYVLKDYDPIAINQIIYKNVKKARSPKTFNYAYSYYSQPTLN